jgi:tetratricopeptide (TPR) repeat protein
VLGSLAIVAALGGPVPVDLVAAAAATNRPVECRPVRRDRAEGRISVWDDARAPALRRYCQLLGRAQARLDSAPDDAAAAAAEAQKLLPGRAAPIVVLARAAMRGGDTGEALQLFEQALGLDAQSVEHPGALHDLGIARMKSGKLREALDTYRLLVPRVSLLPTREERARVLLEAAHVSMALAAEGEQGGSLLDEALAYLREASRDPHQPLRVDVALSLVLALDRAGRREQADAVLAEQAGAAAWEENAGTPSYLPKADEVVLLRALALERTDAAAAAAAYQRYLESATGRWAAAARARLERTRGPARPPARRRGGR